MDEKKTLLIQSAGPIGKDTEIKSFIGLKEEDWLAIEQRAVEKLQTHPLDANALHLCALKIGAGYGTPKRFEEILGQQKLLAHKGDMDAIVNYGYFHYLLEQYQEAIQQFTKAAVKGESAVAMFNRARMYDFGLGSEASLQKAIPFYFQASKRNLPEALAVFESKQDNPVVLRHLIVLQLLQGLSCDITNISTSLDLLSSEHKSKLIVHLLDEMLELIAAKRMTQESFLWLFNWVDENKKHFHDDTFLEGTEAFQKLASIHAHALNQSFLLDLSKPLKIACTYYDPIFSTLERLGEKLKISNLIMRALESDDRLDKKIKNMLPRIISLLAGSDLTSLDFQERFRLFLDGLFEDFKKSLSTKHKALDVLRYLKNIQDADIMYARFRKEHVRQLIQYHRQFPEEKTLVVLRKYVDLHSAKSYLDAHQFNHYDPLGEKLKDEALNGDNASYQRLLDESNEHPELMYWLGIYYEEYYKKNKTMRYPSYAINCFTDAAKKGYVSAYEHLAGCYTEGVLVNKDIEKSFYYLYEAGKRASRHAIPKLETVEGSPRVIILANLYLAMIKGLEGPLSQYYDNPYLKKAVELDQNETDAVILKLIENEALDVHNRIALLQVAFRHDCFVKGQPHIRIIKLLTSAWGSMESKYGEEGYSFVREMVKYINPHYLAEIVINHFSDNSLLIATAIQLLQKIDSKNETLLQLKQHKIPNGSIFPDYDITIDVVKYQTSLNPVQEMKRNHSAPEVEEINNASPFGHDDEFVDKPEKPVANPTTTGFRSLMARGATFLSSFSLPSSSSTAAKPIDQQLVDMGPSQ